MHVAVYNILKRCYEFIVIIEVYLDRIGYGVVYLDRIGYGVWPRSALSYICLQHLCPSKPWLETS